MSDVEPTGNTADYTRCSFPFHDGGLKTLFPACKGKYLIIRRQGPGIMHNNWFVINEVRIFTVPNLLATATVVQAPEPKDPLFKAENLVNNLSTRSGRQDLNAIIAWDRVTGASRTVTRAS